MQSLSLIVPAFNEKWIIADTLDELDAYMREYMSAWAYEILLINDGSTDGMADAVNALTRPNVRVISHEINRGRGAAIRTGFAAARNEFIVTLDADLSYAPYHIKINNSLRSYIFCWPA